MRDGPVQFEKSVEEDPFGLNQFLTEAKKAKRPSDRYSYNKMVDSILLCIITIGMLKLHEPRNQNIEFMYYYNYYDWNNFALITFPK